MLNDSDLAITTVREGMQPRDDADVRDALARVGPKNRGRSHKHSHADAVHVQVGSYYYYVPLRSIKPITSTVGAYR